MREGEGRDQEAGSEGGGGGGIRRLGVREGEE